MTGGRFILIGGGARSGKSAFALTLARALGSRRLFLATAQAGDEEMAERIRRHRQERGADFVTIEEPLAVPDMLRPHGEFDVVVIDCLTLWLSNLLLADKGADEILSRVEDLLAILKLGQMNAVLITNEVGMGLVPETALGRAFRDLTGLAHQRLSQQADEVYVAILGTMLRIKPEPAFIQSSWVKS